MTFTWRYPLHLIPLQGGYVSVVDTDADDPAAQYLAVFTESVLAESFMHHCQILGAPRQLSNAREFAWLLQSLRHPVTRVAFDPQADSPALCSRWQVTVQDLLTRHLVPDNSPWNYPVYVVARADGFASIEGQAGDGSRWTAVGLFSSRDKADAYVLALGTADTVREIADMAEARALLQDLAEDASAVALDPTIHEGRHAASHCLSLRSLLDKYLVPASRR